MGTYIYSLRSPKMAAKVKLDNGNVVTVGRYAYEYKPIFSMFNPEPKWQILARARISRLQKIWDNFIDNGGNYPQAGVLVSNKKEGYKIEIGSTVFSWKINSLPICVEDSTMNNGVALGKVAEILDEKNTNGFDGYGAVDQTGI